MEIATAVSKRKMTALAATEAALTRIESEIPTPETLHLVKFIRASERGICREGRPKSGGIGSDQARPADL